MGVIPFNGAATCSLRNVEYAKTVSKVLKTLQWGRNMFVAECPQAGRIYGRDIRPSMGPQHVRCGMKALKTGDYLFYDPSMGPQHVRCGMPPSLYAVQLGTESFNGAATCSLRNACLARPSALHNHTFNGAATCSLRNVNLAPRDANPVLVLQWGRNMFVAECWQRSAPPRCCMMLPFNGAATCSLRNAVYPKA